jgi:hypothetical protein
LSGKKAPLQRMLSAKRQIRKLKMPPKVAMRIVATWIAGVAGLLLLILYRR